MQRWPLIAAALALALGLAWPAAGPPAALPKLALPGFSIVARHDLVAEGRLHYAVLRNAAGCDLVLAPLDQPEEALPLLRQALPAATMASAVLLLDAQPYPLGSALAVNLRRLRFRLLTGTAPAARFLADPAHCRG
jgi:hypothetical protein